MSGYLDFSFIMFLTLEMTVKSNYTIQEFKDFIIGIILYIIIDNQAYNCLIHFYKRFQIRLMLPGPIVDLPKSEKRDGDYSPTAQGCNRMLCCQVMVLRLDPWLTREMQKKDLQSLKEKEEVFHLSLPSWWSTAVLYQSYSE